MLKKSVVIKHTDSSLWDSFFSFPSIYLFFDFTHTTNHTSLCNVSYQKLLQVLSLRICWQQVSSVAPIAGVSLGPAFSSYGCALSEAGFHVFSCFTLLLFLLSLSFTSQSICTFRYLNRKSVFTKPMFSVAKLNLVLADRA